MAGWPSDPRPATDGRLLFARRDPTLAAAGGAPFMGYGAGTSGETADETTRAATCETKRTSRHRTCYGGSVGTNETRRHLAENHEAAMADRPPGEAGSRHRHG